jgi:putative transposase
MRRFDNLSPHGIRKSKVFLNEVYFWTATVLDWKQLFKPDKYKNLLISSLQNLSKRKKVNVYGFVIMPNHVHLIWEALEMNGRELPTASFLKWTAHDLKHDLAAHHPQVLERFAVKASDREYNFWQRDALATELFNRHVCERKLDYVHLNPLQAHWNLANRPEAYPWSSAQFYLTGEDRFGFLTHYMERL